MEPMEVSLLKADSYDQGLKETLIKLLAPLGGLEAFCKRGDRVLLKPNLVIPLPVESGALTHPAVILSIAELLKDLGCRVGLGDSPGIGSAESVLRKMNLVDSLQKLGVEIIEFHQAGKSLNRSGEFERYYRNYHLAQEINAFDRVVNLAKLKAHGQMGVTLATKNLFGCVVGTAKTQSHYNSGRDFDSFARLLIEIALTVNPTLNIIDGIVGMDGNGPTHGRARPLNILAAGVDPVALDRVILEVIQKRPTDFPLFKTAQQMGLRGAELREIKIYGEQLTAWRITDFEIPSLAGLSIFFSRNRFSSRLVKFFLKSKLVVDHPKCIKCGKCAAKCPAQAIRIHEGVAICEGSCIQCCCCQELCPVGAISLRDTWLVRLLKRLKLV